VAKIERACHRAAAGVEPPVILRVGQHHLLERFGVVVVALDVELKELELVAAEARCAQARHEDRVHARHDAFGAEREERAAGGRLVAEAERQVLAHEVLRVDLELGVLGRGDVEGIAQEAAEQLRVPALGGASTALLPEILRELGAEVVVIAVRHHRGDEASEAARIQLVLRKYVFQIALIETAILKQLEQAVVPHRMLVAELVELVEKGCDPRGLVDHHDTSHRNGCHASIANSVAMYESRLVFNRRGEWCQSIQFSARTQRLRCAALRDQKMTSLIGRTFMPAG
jgi:hypothetical protein